jgi:hypothetical protein
MQALLRNREKEIVFCLLNTKKIKKLKKQL